MTEIFLQNAMDRYGGTVYQLALCRLQCPADAEDVYQDVFLKLYRQHNHPQEDEHLKAWLIRCTLNRCTDLLRFRMRRPVLSLEELPDLMEEADPSAEILWDAVARLPDRLRITVHLYYGEGYSTKEIARLMRCPASTVRTRLKRARNQLKMMIGGIDDEEECISEVDAVHSTPCQTQRTGPEPDQSEEKEASASENGIVRSLCAGSGRGNLEHSRTTEQ